MGEGNVECSSSELAVEALFGREFGELSWGLSQSEDLLQHDKVQSIEGI